MKLRQPATLTARLTLLFAAATFFTFAAVGGYLYRSLAVQLELHDDHELIGKIEQFRHILLETAILQAIRTDQHRFIDAAAGHDGLIVMLKSADGQVLIRNQSGAHGVPDISVVPANENPIFVR